MKKEINEKAANHFNQMHILFAGHFESVERTWKRDIEKKTHRKINKLVNKSVSTLHASDDQPSKTAH